MQIARIQITRVKPGTARGVEEQQMRVKGRVGGPVNWGNGGPTMSKSAQIREYMRLKGSFHPDMQRAIEARLGIKR